MTGLAAGIAGRVRRMRRVHAFALAAALVTFAVHAQQIPSQGLTDDDDFYAPAGIRYAEWLGDVFTQPGTAFSRAGVDEAFQLNHEHPPLAKLVFGVCHAIFHALGMGDLDAARTGCALFAALTAALLVLLLWEPLGAAAALAAPVLLLSLPRFFFHSEVATLDVPVACSVLAVTAAYFQAEMSPGRTRAALVAGVVFGLALLVKLNAPFALVPCALWSLLGRFRGFHVERDAASLRVPPVPPALVAMIVVGPVLFVALWPWLWFDTVARLAAYVAFHLHHYAIYLFYDGEIWDTPFAPWHAVPVLGFGAMPVTVVALGVLGSLRALRGLWRMARFADETGAVPDVTRGDKLRALLFLQAAFSMAVVANPTTPRYGGEKLFMPFFPLWCALAADGAVLVIDALATLVPRVARVRAIAFAVVVLAALPGFFGTVHFHGGYALSYYGELVGGLRGAVARGFERTYYDVADKPLARFLDANAERVHFEPNHKEYARTYRWLKRDGVVSQRLTLDARDAPVTVLTHERRWSTYPALKARLERETPLLTKSIDGVPLYTVYRR